MTTTIAGTAIRSQYARQALTQHGMVAAILTAHVILAAQRVWEAERWETIAGEGTSEADYREAQEERIAATDDYHATLRLAEAASR